jgi:hypothetical protein
MRCCRAVAVSSWSRWAARQAAVSFAFEGIFEQRLAIDLELFAGGFRLAALIEFGKQFLDLGDDAVLFGGWRNGNFAGAEIRRRYRRWPTAPDCCARLRGARPETIIRNCGLMPGCAKDVKLCRAEAKAIVERRNDGSSTNCASIVSNTSPS